ncbi:MAG: carbohydrate ABC transporter permease [Candidatus Limivivens sp.]|nr:carbohydrate ABC transporter permease [Candidatus Limivivens sp.]
MRRKKRNRILYHVLTLAGGIVMIYPLLWMVGSSLKETSTIFSTASQLIPENLTFENYVNGWQGFSKVNFGTFIKNTLFVAVIATVLTVLSSALVAYGLARLRYRGRNLVFAMVLLTMMLPGEIMMIPQYLWYNKLGWINTYLPMTIPFGFAIQGFFVYQMKNFIEGLPRELDEAAKIDGCSYYTIFLRIIVPLLKPAMGTVAIFSFINRWNDYMSPLLYLKTVPKYTVSLALKLFCDQSSTSDYGAMFAMSVVSLIPIVMIFIFLQRYLIEGISTQGLKG